MSIPGTRTLDTVAARLKCAVSNALSHGETLRTQAGRELLAVTVEFQARRLMSIVKQLRRPLPASARFKISNHTNPHE